MKKSKLPPEFQVLLVPLALICAMVILFAIVYNIGVSRINQQNTQLAITKKNEGVLSERVSVLQAVSGTVATQAKAADAAVPSINPGLITLSQMKTLAGKTSLNIIDFGIGSEVLDVGGLKKVEVDITVEGKFLDVVSFVSQLNTIAPIAVPTKVRMTTAGGISRASFSVNSYFAPLPTKLPALTEPVTKLTTAETDVITKISSLTQPAFLELSPQAAVPRTNPF